MRVELNQVREELEECVRSLDLDRAQELKLKLRCLEEEHTRILQEISTPAQTPTTTTSSATTPSAEAAEEVVSTAPAEGEEEGDQQEPVEKDDPQTLSRCLTIVSHMLKSPEITTINSTLYSLHDNLLLPCLKNQVRGSLSYPT